MHLPLVLGTLTCPRSFSSFPVMQVPAWCLKNLLLSSVCRRSMQSPRCYLRILIWTSWYTCMARNGSNIRGALFPAHRGVGGGWDENCRTLPSGVCLAEVLFRSLQIYSGCAACLVSHPLLELAWRRGLTLQTQSMGLGCSRFKMKPSRLSGRLEY